MEQWIGVGQALLRYPLVSGALSGWASAALADYAAFRTWKSFDEALAYGWKVALWRWCQGAITGAITALGIGAIS